MESNPLAAGSHGRRQTVSFNITDQLARFSFRKLGECWRGRIQADVNVLGEPFHGLQANW